jgi:hypothetical protein
MSCKYQIFRINCKWISRNDNKSYLSITNEWTSQFYYVQFSHIKQLLIEKTGIYLSISPETQVKIDSIIVHINIEKFENRWKHSNFPVVYILFNKQWKIVKQINSRILFPVDPPSPYSSTSQLSSYVSIFSSFSNTYPS